MSHILQWEERGTARRWRHTKGQCGVMVYVHYQTEQNMQRVIWFCHKSCGSAMDVSNTNVAAKDQAKRSLAASHLIVLSEDPLTTYCPLYCRQAIPRRWPWRVRTNSLVEVLHTWWDKERTDRGSAVERGRYIALLKRINNSQCKGRRRQYSQSIAQN